MPDVASPFSVELIRPDDQLWLRFDFLDLCLSGDELVADGPAPAVRVTFAPQHIAEQSQDAAVTPGTAAVRETVARPSRLVFAVSGPVDFTVSGLLAFADRPLLVQAAATGAEPSADVCALELPVSLVLSPEAGARFETDAFPRERDGVTALWTARMDDGGGVVALWNRAPADDPGLGLGTRPNAADRDHLVAATAVAPASVTRLWLSSHGAFADLVGDWSGVAIERWIQRTTAGRDLQVEIASRGFLAPFGHAASAVSVTERTLTVDAAGLPVAALLRRDYLVVTGRTVSFPAPHRAPDGGRRFPFVSVTAEDAGWIPVDEAPFGAIPVADAWSVVEAVGGDEVTLAFTAVDRAGNPAVSFRRPVVFVPWDRAFDTGQGSTTRAVIDAWNALPAAEREVDLAGAQVAFADEVAAGSGASSKGTERIRLVLERPTGGSDSTLRADRRPGFFPAVDRAWVVDDALSTAEGRAAAPMEVTFHDRWLDHGLAADNFDQAFLRLEPERSFLLGGEGRAVFSVDLLAQAFNQTIGAGPDLASATEVWDPATALGTASKVLGVIPLHELLAGGVSFSNATDGVDVPAVEVTVTPDAVVSTLRYAPPLHDLLAVGLEALPGAAASLLVENRIALTGGDPPATTVDVRLDRIRLSFPPAPLTAVVIDFDTVRVLDPPDGPLDVDFDVASWEFGGLLTWLRPIADLLGGAGEEPAIDVAPSGVEVAISIPGPDLKMGVLSVRNFAVGLDLDLPFDGRPVEVAASLGSRGQPVEVSVLTFDGSFYLEARVSPDGGLLALTASAEVDAQLIGIDIVVAEASIGLGLGACYQLRGGEVVFTGTVSLQGVLDILGLLNVSLGVVASLSYKSATENLVLKGDITWSIDTFLGGDSGRVPIGRTEFPLSDGPAVRSAVRAMTVATAGPQPVQPDRVVTPVDVAVAVPDHPGFVQRYSPADWDIYTGAFAP